MHEVSASEDVWRYIFLIVNIAQEPVRASRVTLIAIIENISSVAGQFRQFQPLARQTF